jgi:hypothetical protein
VCCEVIGLHVHMVCANAGGGNTTLFSLLRKRLVEQRGNHLYTPMRQICIVPCVVHGQKAMQNNLLKLQEDGTQGFIKYGTLFG